MVKKKDVWKMTDEEVKEELSEYMGFFTFASVGAHPVQSRNLLRGFRMKYPEGKKEA